MCVRTPAIPSRRSGSSCRTPPSGGGCRSSWHAGWVSRPISASSSPRSSPGRSCAAWFRSSPVTSPTGRSGCGGEFTICCPARSRNTRWRTHAIVAQADRLAPPGPVVRLVRGKARYAAISGTAIPASGSTSPTVSPGSTTNAFSIVRTGSVSGRAARRHTGKRDCGSAWWRRTARAVPTTGSTPSTRSAGT